MSKTERAGDADGSVGNSSDDGGFDGSGVFDTKVVMRLMIVMSKLAGELAECNGSFIMEMRVGVM